jgi:hypothetical protein
MSLANSKLALVGAGVFLLALARMLVTNGYAARAIFPGGRIEIEPKKVDPQSKRTKDDH